MNFRQLWYIYSDKFERMTQFAEIIKQFMEQKYPGVDLKLFYIEGKFRMDLIPELLKFINLKVYGS